MKDSLILKFPTILLFVGSVFFLLGVSGQTKIYNQIIVGSNNLIINILIIIVGIICIIFSYYSYYLSENKKHMTTQDNHTNLSKDSNKEKAFSPNIERISSLIGDWRGILYQTNLGHDLETPINGKIFIDKEKIKGKINIKVTLPEMKEYDFSYSIYMKFVNDRFLNVEYKNDEDKFINMGVIFLELSPMGDSMNGYGAGYGLINQDLVSFSIKLEKV